jgi:hypothetical protein
MWIYGPISLVRSGVGITRIDESMKVLLTAGEMVVMQRGWTVAVEAIVRLAFESTQH